MIAKKLKHLASSCKSIVKSKSTRVCTSTSTCNNKFIITLVQINFQPPVVPLSCDSGLSLTLTQITPAAISRRLISLRLTHSASTHMSSRRRQLEVEDGELSDDGPSGDYHRRDHRARRSHSRDRDHHRRDYGGWDRDDRDRRHRDDYRDLYHRRGRERDRDRDDRDRVGRHRPRQSPSPEPYDDDGRRWAPSEDDNADASWHQRGERDSKRMRTDADAAATALFCRALQPSAGAAGNSQQKPLQMLAESTAPAAPVAAANNNSSDEEQDEDEMDEEELIELRRRQRKARTQQLLAATKEAASKNVSLSSSPKGVPALGDGGAASAAVAAPETDAAAASPATASAKVGKHPAVAAVQQQDRRAGRLSYGSRCAVGGFTTDGNDPFVLAGSGSEQFGGEDTSIDTAQAGTGGAGNGGRSFTLEQPTGPSATGTTPPPDFVDLTAGGPAADRADSDGSDPAAAADPSVDDDDDDHEEGEGGIAPARAADSMTLKEKQAKILRETMLKLRAVEERLMAARAREEAAAQAKACKDVDMFSLSPVKGENIFGTAAVVAAAGTAASTATVSAGVQKENFTDAEGYLVFRPGDMLADRFEILGTLGKGVFSSVFSAVDTTGELGGPAAAVGGRSNVVAVKVIRANDTMYKAAQKEIEILHKLQAADPNGRRHCVRLLDSLEWKGHMCLVFESLAMNLRDLVKRYGKGGGISIEAVRVFGKQLFQALRLLRETRIMHCDLKPDNVLVNAALTSVKLCDFGSAAMLEENEVTPYLVSRFYRAPEVIQGVSYDNRIDVWSAACTLFELYTGRILFPGEDNTDMLRVQMETRGKLSSKMIRKGAFRDKYFEPDNGFVYYEADKGARGRGVKRTVHAFNAKESGRSLEALLFTRKMGEVERTAALQFKDLLDQLLVLDPTKRLQPAEALKHPFFMSPAPTQSSLSAQQQ